MSQALRLSNSKSSESCHVLARTVDGTKATAKVVPGIVNGTWILIVDGKKPYLNMTVRLSPLTYVQQPDYWGIEVIGCLPGIALPAIAPYHEVLPLNGVMGKNGVEVIWSDGTEKIDIGGKSD